MREALFIKMTKEQLAPWIDKLNAAGPKDYDGIVAAMCGENGIKKKAAWTLLKEAGFVPKTGAPPADEPTEGEEKESGKPSVSPAPPVKKRVKHEKLKGKNLIAGNKTIAFDADGIAELDAVDADILLTIPGYTEVKEQ
jgi:hypothetical protein